MGIESRYIWMDGKLVPFADANVHVLSHTLHYGLGVFEGIRCYPQTAGGGGVRWYEFRIEDSHVKLYQQGTYAPLHPSTSAPEEDEELA